MPTERSLTTDMLRKLNRMLDTVDAAYVAMLDNLRTALLMKLKDIDECTECRGCHQCVP